MKGNALQRYMEALFTVAASFVAVAGFVGAFEDAPTSWAIRLMCFLAYALFAGLTTMALYPELHDA